MSRDFNIHCKDCDDTHRFNDANWRHELMKDIIANADAIANIHDLATHESIEFGTTFGRIHTDWFVKHKGHHLVVRDEYGHNYDDCPKQTKCPHCGHKDYCKLPQDHEGECDMKPARY